MTDLNHSEIKRRSELLATARQLVNKEYMARRAEQHKQWLTKSESFWRTNGTLLPYPSGILYPTEEEIVSKALELYNASTPSLQSKVNLPEVTLISEEPSTTYTPAIVPVEPQDMTPSDTIKSDDISVNSLSIDQLQEPESVTVDEVPTDTIQSEIIDEPKEVVSDEVQAIVTKNSLLRNVLSGWLQKNKDKET